MQPPDLMHTHWRCEACGPVLPLHRPRTNSIEVLGSVRRKVLATDNPVPLWCPWPMLPGWTVAGVGWVGDDRSGPRATAVTLSGPAPLGPGPAELVLVAEEPGIGLGTGLAGRPGEDPGPGLEAGPAQAKLRADGHPTPLWAVDAGPDQCAFVGEARGMWLMVLTWPAAAGYLLAEEITLTDLVEAVPSELVFGAPSRQLSPHRREG